MEHTVFLELPYNLKQGKTYAIDFKGNSLKDIKFTHDLQTTRSEAVHVSHLGFTPNDPAKVAFLSTWMGNGGGLSYGKKVKFWLVDEVTGKRVYRGSSKNVKKASQAEDALGNNYNGTDVHMLDFSEFDQPGQYRVQVKNIGTSFPFQIGDQAWEEAFTVSARGMYHQRSGIALEQPYTDYERPRPFHPDDGLVVYQSTVPLMDTDMGLGDRDAFEALTSTRTNTIVPDAWGGWFDAGDWDRPHSASQRDARFFGTSHLCPELYCKVWS